MYMRQLYSPHLLYHIKLIKTKNSVVYSTEFYGILQLPLMYGVPC